jgi:hypothetical protein
MILKMIPGQRIHFTVTNTEEVKGNFGPQIKFSGTTPDDSDAVMFLNVDAAHRQLGRIGLDTSSVVGRTVEFARTEKNGTKYTDINLPANGAPPKAKVDQTPRAYSSGPHIPGIDGPYQETGAPPADESVSRLDGVLSLHDVCVMHATKSTARILKDAGFTPTAADILAAAATQMIGAQKIGARVG